MSRPLYNGGVVGEITPEGRPRIKDDGNWSLQGAPPGEGPAFRSLLLIVNGSEVWGYRPTARREPFAQATARQGVFTRQALLDWLGSILAPRSAVEMILVGGDRYEGWGDTAGEDWMEWGSQNPSNVDQTVLATTGILHVPSPPDPPDPEPEPEPEPPPQVTVIGSQHGITAMCDHWRSVWPQWTKQNRDPNNLSTWGAIDKLERTLLILAEDHDAKR